MLVRKLLLCIFSAAGLCASHQIQAVPIQWTLSGVTFTDGGTASGSFVYDADLQTVSQYDVTTTAGAALAGDHYLDLTGNQPPYPPAGFAIIETPTPGDYLNHLFLALSFASPLSNAGGIDPLLGNGGEGFCSTTTCSVGSYRRLTNAGVVVGTTIPEPGTIALIAAALAGFAFSGRRGLATRVALRRIPQ